MKRILLLLGTFLPSPLRLMIWRMLGFRVGTGCRVSPLSIVVADDIELGHGAVIETLCLIFAPSKLRLGERARMASFNRVIGYGEVILDKQSFIALGNLIEASPGYRFRLGARSQLGPRGTYYTHGATHLLFNVGYPHRHGDIVIGDDVWLGMCTVVYPKVTIGSRVLGFAGMIITRDLDGGRLVFPPSDSYKTLPIERVGLLPGGSDRDKLESMKATLTSLGALHASSQFDKTERDWTLHLPAGRRVVLLLEGDDSAWRHLPPRQTVLWKLEAAAAEPSAPTFCFRELTVYGGWTPFAERVAALLCGRLGFYFVFDSRQRR